MIAIVDGVDGTVVVVVVVAATVGGAETYVIGVIGVKPPFIALVDGMRS